VSGRASSQGDPITNEGVAVEAATSPRISFRRPVIVTALIALMLGLMPVGVAAADIEARGTGNVCDPPFLSTFVDIAGSVHAANVRCMADHGLTQGTGDGTTYSPRRAVTRAQMATFIARWIEHYAQHELGDVGYELPEGTARFDDVPDASVHATNIHKLATIGVTQGTAASDGTSFAPERPVTRGQMASFISGAASYLGTGQATPASQPPRTDGDLFPDDDGSVHEANIDALASVGVVAGFPDGTYRPGASVLRDQMATFIMQTYDWAVVVGLGGPELGTIAGIVSDANSNHPIAGATLSLSGTTDEATSGADGRYEIADVLPGSHTVTVSATGYDPATRAEVVVTAGDVSVVDFDLTPRAVDIDHALTVRLNWQNQYREAEGRFGGVDDYAAYHLDPDGAGQATFKWDDGAETVVIEGETTLTAPATTFTLHEGALDEEAAVTLTLTAPSFRGDASDTPTADDRGSYRYSLDGTVHDAALIAALDAAATGNGLADWYVSVQTTRNPEGEVRGQLGSASVTDGGLASIVPIYRYVEFHELGEGTNTGEPQTSFNLLFDAWVDFLPATQDWPDPEDFELIRERDGVEEELPILRVRGNNPEWQPYPKPDLRLHLDTVDVIEDGDIVTVTMLDSGAAKLLPYGRNAAAGDVSDSWRTRCTHVISVLAMTSEPCGTPPRAGLSGYEVTPITSAPHQEQEFSVTIEEPGLPAGEELWIDLIDVSHDGLVDYSDSTWTATVDGEVVGTVEFWEYEEVERYQTVWEPYLGFSHAESTPVGGELVLSGSGIDASDAAVHGEDTAYETFVVRHDTGRADYAEVEVTFVPQPTITLEPADAVLLAEAGSSLPVTATYTEADGDPVAGAEIRFWVEQGERPDIEVVDLEPGTTDADGRTTVTYPYDARHVEIGEPLIDTLRAELVEDPFIDARTTVTWATGVATNDGPGHAEGVTYHDLNDAVIDAEEGDTITAVGGFTSVYGLVRGDRIHVTKALTLRTGADGASLLGAFDVRASGATVEGFHVTHAGNMHYAFRVEGAGITISNNVIDAAGADGFRVRDAWRPVPDGGSATISENTITNAAIAIGVDGDGKKHEFEVVVHLDVLDNRITDSGTGIYYAAAAASTMTVTDNHFEALTDASDVYVEDARTADLGLDLDAILAANTYDPEGEILGAKIVPIDPTHVPSMVRVVEHGTGQGKQYSIIAYTRGVACHDDRTAVASQFELDRGTDKTPNRIGESVECSYDGNPSLIMITWDGNPSFPNEISYIEHPDPAYRVHNEHPLAGGGFTAALSPDTVGSPFPKPEDETVSGAVYLSEGGVTLDGRAYVTGQILEAVDLTVSIAARSEPLLMDLRLEVVRPGEDVAVGADVCAELFAEDSCDLIVGALAEKAGFSATTTFLEGASLQLAPDAASGEWQLRWSVVDTGSGEPHFTDTFRLTISHPSS
jgi:hypothetical protein